MAFVDTLLTETDSSFVMVDRHHMPGGHWCDAYPFVRLHQPSAFYGVPSTELGSNRIDETGSNAGFYELASGAEVSAYFERVMRERFLPSGRVQYFSMCDYVGDGNFRSLLSGKEYAVSIARKTVDGTFFNTSVPSTHERKFDVDANVECVAPNELPRRASSYQQFTILGGGKTGMDAAVWLLESGADPSSISWVCPRDSWLINRSTTQPGSVFFEQAAGGFAAQLEALRDATSVDDAFERMEAVGVMLRVDQTRQPTMFHYATMSQGEIDQLRRIERVIRGGRVARVSGDKLIMQDGSSVSAARQTLYVDCTATAVQFVGSKTKPVFEPERVTPQALTAPLVATSAAIAAFVEAHFDSDEEKNRLCTPVPLADTPSEWMVSFLGNMQNQNAWSQVPKIRAWMSRCRLDPGRTMPGDTAQDDKAIAAVKGRIGQNIGPAVGNVQKLLQAAAAMQR